MLSKLKSANFPPLPPSRKSLAVSKLKLDYRIELFHMNSEIKNSYSKSYKQKKAVISYGIIIWSFVGLIASGFVLENIKNYNSPYLFGSIFLSIGIITGTLIAKKLKSKLAINRTMKLKYDGFTIKIVFGFIGLSLLLGQIVNSFLSTKVKCDNYAVKEKYEPGRSTRTRNYILAFNVDGVYYRYSTRYQYWKTISVDQQVNICTYKSKMGFDFINLTDEK